MIKDMERIDNRIDKLNTQFSNLITVLFEKKVITQEQANRIYEE